MRLCASEAIKPGLNPAEIDRMRSPQLDCPHEIEPKPLLQDLYVESDLDHAGNTTEA
jgi:hypothetical protein